MLRSPRPRRYSGLAPATRGVSYPLISRQRPGGRVVAGSLSVVITVAVRALGGTLMTLLRAVHWRDKIIPHDCPSRRDQRADAPVKRIFRRGIDAAASGCRR